MNTENANVSLKTQVNAAAVSARCGDCGPTDRQNHVYSQLNYKILCTSHTHTVHNANIIRNILRFTSSSLLHRTCTHTHTLHPTRARAYLLLNGIFVYFCGDCVTSECCGVPVLSTASNICIFGWTEWCLSSVCTVVCMMYVCVRIRISNAVVCACVVKFHASDVYNFGA